MARQFREDLYFRLSVFPIRVPALRERAGDITILAQHFIGRFCREMNKPLLRLSDEATSLLETYPWPGNVRELQNCIERAVILAEGDVIHARYLNLAARAQPGAPAPAPVAGPWEQLDLSGTLGEAVRRVTEEVERRKIAEALQASGGDKARAAELLQISVKALLSKQRDYGLAE
jgi:DNA-binding NtrC family response regulator